MFVDFVDLVATRPMPRQRAKPEADAADFETAVRHPEHADERYRADCVCDRLNAMELEEPAHIPIVS